MYDKGFSCGGPMNKELKGDGSDGDFRGVPWIPREWYVGTNSNNDNDKTKQVSFGNDGQSPTRR